MKGLILFLLFTFRILHNAESLELRAFTLQCLLAMNRPDLARKQLKALQDIEDDSTLTQLAQAWLNLSEVSKTTIPSEALLN